MRNEIITLLFRNKCKTNKLFLLVEFSMKKYVKRERKINHLVVKYEQI
jgi:hypothetical protein